jgi:hypothetical protein
MSAIPSGFPLNAAIPHLKTQARQLHKEANDNAFRPIKNRLHGQGALESRQDSGLMRVSGCDQSLASLLHV